MYFSFKSALLLIILGPRCRLKTSRCLPILVSRSNKSCRGSGCGMNMLFWERQKNSPSLTPLIPNLTNVCTRKISSIMQSTSSCWFLNYGLFFKIVFLSALLFLQLEIKLLKLFDATIFDSSLTIKEVSDMIFLSSYIQQLRLVIWDICFFQEFKPKDGIQRRKPWE